MKNNIGIWCDGTRALFVNANTGETTEVLSNIENAVYHDNEGDKGNFNAHGHNSNEKKFDERKKHQTKDYIESIIAELKTAEGIYVFGPAETKIHLKKAIEEDRNLSDKLSAVESADKMTDNQIVAAVKAHFN